MFLACFQTSLRVGFGASALLAALLLVACAPEPSKPPSEIVGTWVTDAPRYEGRHFEVRDDAIVFGTGRFSASLRHSLVSVETEPEPGPDGWIPCVLHYREPDGAVSDLVLSYRVKPRLQLRFEHRKGIWTRLVATRKAADNETAGTSMKTRASATHATGATRGERDV